MRDIISMEQKERQQYFVYLIILTVISVALLSVIFLRKMPNPFNNDQAFEMNILKDHKKFNDKQAEVYPFMEKTFQKIDVLPITQLKGFAESDIINSIADISNVAKDQQLNDMRKENFPQIASFYKMYLNDKKIAFAKLQNIALYEKQYTECNIGFKEKEQQLSQKNAAISARSH